MDRVKDLHELLFQLALPVVTAESCTGGMLVSTLTSRPGASSIVAGGVVAYSNLVKSRLLNVESRILDVEQGGPGEVSAECALAMARGVLESSGVLEKDVKGFEQGSLTSTGRGLAISTTGYLQGGPVGRDGEVWIGCHWKFGGREGSRVKQIFTSTYGVGDVKEVVATRQELKEWVVTTALEMAIEVASELSRELTSEGTAR